MRLRFTRPAEDDLEAIADFLAPRDLTGAVRIVLDLRARCRRLESFPLSGAEAGPPAPPGVRRLVVGAYVAFYRVEARGVLVLRVAHGARDLSAVARDLPPGAGGEGET